MRLFFLRHADADSSGQTTDTDRMLTQTGIDEASIVAAAIAAMKLDITLIFTSPFVRARQTADIVAKQFPSIKVQALNYLLSNSDPQSLFRELQSFPRDARALLVSHEPFISRCIANLIGFSGDAKISIKKATLSCVEVGSPVQRGAGILLWLMTNEQLRLMKL
ncbi:MAG TPA: phosphohistidine phosphatase SixA [Bacteroidota bacterium]|nr:phosphohistidine phosphatase SixA [Bacteroidota bacterium]